MSNRLAGEESPYLRQHKDNPVDWYPWGAEALERARQEDKPIFLSIGYAACHWCHVMEHESFEDPQTAALMNANFVNIKVDREERPDLDGIYMSAVVAMTGSGGWPMSLFLTPSGEPFYGGTYFPPVGRFNLPGFKDILGRISAVWNRERTKLLETGQRLRQHLLERTETTTGAAPLSLETLQKSVISLAQGYDWQHGGWGSAPKFPQPMAIEFLLRQAARGDRPALDVAVHALASMSRGGMYDLVGGGFARYSVDDRWLVPHFEKMLYDNAQLALVYLHGYLLTGEVDFLEVLENTFEFVQRELTHPLGGFYSSLDADSEGEEGKFYVWTREEIETALPDESARQLFFEVIDAPRQGNFEGRVVLQKNGSIEELAEQIGSSPVILRAQLKESFLRLRKVRESRVRPSTDDKIIVSWNALMVIAFAEAGRYLSRDDYSSVAMRNLDFLLDLLYLDGRLRRSGRADGSSQTGRPRHLAYLEDYAALILALLAVYQSDPQPRWFQTAARLTDEMIALFHDPNGNWYDTGSDHETLLVRPREVQDNATPSGGSLAANALLQMGFYCADTTWLSLAEALIQPILPFLNKYPTAFANWSSAADWLVGPVHEIAVLAPSGAGLAHIDFYRQIWVDYRPRLVASVSEYPPGPGTPPLLQDRPLLDNRPTAFLCQGFVCLQPVNDLASWIDLLKPLSIKPRPAENQVSPD